MLSDSDDEELLVAVNRRYWLISIVIGLQLLMNVLFVFTTGWILIIFNVPSVLGALSLFSRHPEDFDFNKRGMQMYLVGYTKAVFMVLILVFTAYRIDALKETDPIDEEKLLFFENLQRLCQINCAVDLVYSFLGIFILRLTQNILRYLTEREQMDLSSLLSEERNTTRLTNLTNTRIEMRSFRE